ncbi:helicase-exonuclease AddAB subunit AddA [Clostridium sp. B9]|uniref:helicase-exonuclease AddAB subunit AddA n=1 Tax=Clostridium sp. B9 TaxID=3423224 RepID=UPI003D2EA0A6
MATKWTKEQELAINTRKCNLLVAAAAGSGKTAVLVERIIKMITDGENPVDIDKLLVVTFTNAAASEMRERIGDAISKALEKDPSSEILQRQLALLNRASITTMHSFCLEVIKNNFHLIDLDPGFRIGDQTECELIKQDILADLFEDMYAKEDECFLDLVEAYGGSKSDDNLNSIIFKFYNFIMSGPWPENWLKEKVEEFNVTSVAELENKKWIAILKESIALELDNAYSMLTQAREIAELGGGLEPYLVNIEPEISQLEVLRSDLNKSIVEFYHTLMGATFGRLKSIRKTSVDDEKALEKTKNLRNDSKKIVENIRDKVFQTSLDDAVIGMQKMYPLMKCLSDIVIEFSNRYRDKKREKDILDFNDLEHLCLEILINKDEKGNVTPSQVALEFRDKFEEVLVDEYQDSNTIQETIVGMVSRRDVDKPNVFMVGDVKQSIYKFRQANPELFLDKYNNYSEEESLSRKIMLYKNFRSRKEVIDGVNYIFQTLMSTSVGELEYDEKEALNLGASYNPLSEENVEEEYVDELSNLKASGDIELHVLNKAGTKEFEFEDGDDESQEEEEDLDSIQLEARIIGKRIKELMNPSDGTSYMVFDKDLGKYRKIKFKDIVILLRATKNWAETFVDELGTEGIPVYADTGTGYFQTIEIRTIMALLHIIDNPMQDIYILSALRSPIFSFSSEEFADLRLLSKDKYFYEIIKEVASGEHKDAISEELKDKCEYFLESLKRWREKAAYTPIDEFIWYLYSDTSYYGYVGTMPNGVQRQANLRILFQRAKQYESTSFKGLFNFINFINKLRKSSGDMGSAKILGENEDVVRIMSIHKSKGLEFPVVILGGTGKQFNKMDLREDILLHETLGIGTNCIDVKKRIKYDTLQKHAIKKKCELEVLSEEMRILYVAFTRAKEKLIITGSVSDLEKSCENWCKAGAATETSRINPGNVLKGKSYLDWIGMALTKHKDGDAIRHIGSGDIRINDEDISNWSFKAWERNELISSGEVSIEKEHIDIFNSEEWIASKKEIKDVIDIRNRLGFKYKYIESCNIPSNISVTEIKRVEQEEIIPAEFNLIEEDKKEKERIKRKPKFMEEKEEEFSAAKKGTITHFAMQHINLDKVTYINEIKEELELMVQKELLTEEESKVVNVFKIQKFFKSNLGQRMLDAHKSRRKVYRELPFITEIPSTRINKELDKKLYKDEKLRLQGIIDAFFEEEDGYVLLDYKTDYVEEGKEQEFLDKYRVQIELYSDTLKKILGEDIKEAYLYSFYLEKDLKIK